MRKRRRIFIKLNFGMIVNGDVDGQNVVNSVIDISALPTQLDTIWNFNTVRAASFDFACQSMEGIKM